jgi:hypothetical protein
MFALRWQSGLAIGLAARLSSSAWQLGVAARRGRSAWQPMPRVSGILERIEYANGVKGIITSQDEMIGALRRSMYKVPRGFLLKSTDEAFSWDAYEIEVSAPYGSHPKCIAVEGGIRRHWAWNNATLGPASDPGPSGFTNIGTFFKTDLWPGVGLIGDPDAAL